MTLWGKSRDSYLLIKLCLAIGLLVLILSFQNCGSPSGTGLFSGSDEDYTASRECVSSVVGCNPLPEFLILQMQMPIPFEIPVNHAIPISGDSFSLYFDIQGVCNDGDYPRHMIKWEIIDNEAADPSVSRGVVNDPCVDGEFNVTASIDASLVRSLTLGKDYEMFLKLIGLDSSSREVENPRLEHQDIINIRFYRAGEGQ